MEEDPLERIEDDNHNCDAAEGVCVSVCSPEQVCVDYDSSSESDSSATSAANSAALHLNPASKFRKLHLLNTVVQRCVGWQHHDTTIHILW